MRKGLLICAVLLTAFTASASLEEMASALDQTIANIEMAKIEVRLAETLSIEKPTLHGALVEKKLRLSDLVLAKLVSEKTEGNIGALLGAAPFDWADLLKRHDVPEADAEEYLDNTQTEVALMMLDFREVKR